MKGRLFAVVAFICLLASCIGMHDKVKKREIENLLKEWIGKTIIFPNEILFDFQNELENKDFVIVNYIDSVGCLNCKLNLRKWKSLISEYDTLTNKNIGYLFILQSAKLEDLIWLIQWDKFTGPICFDENNIFCTVNDLPRNEMFHTFLLSKEHELIAVGNPVDNYKVKELYRHIIQGKTVSYRDKEVSSTIVSLSNRLFKLGTFPWQQPQTATFSFKNTGTLPLVIQDVSTSCGCTTVEYDPKPVQPGGSLDIQVTYKAEHPEHFDKTVTVYCNAEDSPIVLKIQGNAE